MVHPKEHPISSNTYVNQKCRCAGCRKAASDLYKRNRHEREAERILLVDDAGQPLLTRRGKPRFFHPKAKHGTDTGAKYYGCQCDACMKARTEAQMRQRNST